MPIMGRRTLREKILYKMVYLGEVEKNGQIVKKYKKVSRFPRAQRKDILAYVFVFSAILIIAVFVNMLVSGMKPKGSIEYSPSTRQF